MLLMLFAYVGGCFTIFLMARFACFDLLRDNVLGFG